MLNNVAMDAHREGDLDGDLKKKISIVRMRSKIEIVCATQSWNGAKIL